MRFQQTVSPAAQCVVGNLRNPTALLAAGRCNRSGVSNAKPGVARESLGHAPERGWAAAAIKMPWAACPRQSSSTASDLPSTSHRPHVRTHPHHLGLSACPSPSVRLAPPGVRGAHSTSTSHRPHCTSSRVARPWPPVFVFQNASNSPHTCQWHLRLQYPSQKPPPAAVWIMSIVCLRRTAPSIERARPRALKWRIPEAGSTRRIRRRGSRACSEASPAV